ncbi:hypothetical protein OEZ86_012521 [Tetradesmus obliquus]|nr:hypothetical protein OEZ86_012521 [Tetradesmus obliquus]
MDKRPTALQAVLKIANGCLFYKQLDEERLGFINNLKLTIHIVQRLVRLLLSPFLRIVIKHPLGWPLEQELLCTLMFGILQSRQVSAWRGFFGAVGELQAWVPVQVQRLAAGPCSAVWIRLPPEKEPQQPRARVNMVFFHGGAFVAGDALMYLGTHAYWLHKLAAAGISCSILSVDYPLAPEHPFPAAVEAAADVIEWLANESGETAPYILAGDSAGGNSVADNIHHYLHDPALLCHPLVSPALLPDLSGLSQRGMMVVAGGAELMRPDIAAFAAKVKAAGVPVQYHEEPGECHCYALLALPHLLQKSHTVLDYIGQVALAAAAAAGPGLAGPAAAAAAGPAAEPAPAELQERESDTQSKL